MLCTTQLSLSHYSLLSFFYSLIQYGLLWLKEVFLTTSYLTAHSFRNCHSEWMLFDHSDHGQDLKQFMISSTTLLAVIWCTQLTSQTAQVTASILYPLSRYWPMMEEILLFLSRRASITFSSDSEGGCHVKSSSTRAMVLSCLSCGV